MRINTKTNRPPPRTHQGAVAARISPIAQLRRSVMSCFLWEREFYEDGDEIATRIQALVADSSITSKTVSDLAVESRTVFHLRHVPLLLLAAAARCGKLHHAAVTATIQRADEMAELLSIHAKLNGIKPSELKGHIPNQMKRGLSDAFLKFSEYSLAKYNRDGDVKLRDVMFLCHPKPADDAKVELFKRVASNALAVPDTWEVALSGGADKAETFTRLLDEKNLGYLALLRNLRNMEQAGVDRKRMQDAIIARENGADKVLPFRYIAAARACPSMEPALDQALCEAVMDAPILDGTTIVLVDVSGSMDEKISARSDLKRCDAAAAVASLIHGDRRVFSFSNQIVEVPARVGMAGVDAILASQHHGGTELFNAIRESQSRVGAHHRMIVITDEQAEYDPRNMPAPLCPHAYVINVASAKNGVGYGKWTHIDGFSEGVIRYIREAESASV